MIYNCGHRGCDVCGGRECTGLELKKYKRIAGDEIIVCFFCTMKALKLAISMAESFGGTVIDVTKPCGREVLCLQKI